MQEIKRRFKFWGETIGCNDPGVLPPRYHDLRPCHVIPDGVSQWYP